jgi:hypothetical protein
MSKSGIELGLEDSRILQYGAPQVNPILARGFRSGFPVWIWVDQTLGRQRIFLRSRHAFPAFAPARFWSHLIHAIPTNSAGRLDTSPDRPGLLMTI